MFEAQLHRALSEKQELAEVKCKQSGGVGNGMVHAGSVLRRHMDATDRLLLARVRTAGDDCAFDRDGEPFQVSHPQKRDWYPHQEHDEQEYLSGGHAHTIQFCATSNRTGSYRQLMLSSGVFYCCRAHLWNLVDILELSRSPACCCSWQCWREVPRVASP